MSPLLRGVAGVLAGVFLPQPALAANDWLEDLPCSGGTIAHSEIIGALLEQSQLAYRGDVLMAFAEHRLGLLTLQQIETRSPARESFLLLLTNTRSLFEEASPVGTVILTTEAPEDLWVAFLNRETEQSVRFTCSATIQTVDDTQTERSIWDSLIVTSVDDAGATQGFADRPFATLSYLRDGTDGEETISTDIYVGFSEPVLGPFRPSLAYQRQTGSSPLNDLTFGLRYDVGRLTFSADYETDDEFDSSAWRARAVFDALGHRNICHWLGADGTNGRPVRGGRCDLLIMADHIGVEDPGEKADLASATEFTRVGLRGSASYWFRVGREDIWRLQAYYEAYETVVGDDGDASLGRISLEYMERETSPISVGFSYANGTDPTSLGEIDEFRVTLGYRH